MKKLFKFLVISGIVVAVNGLFIGLLFLAMVYQKLPDLEVIGDYRPRLPLRVYSAEGNLIGEFGEERRTFTEFDDFPHALINALLATEDTRFYDHHGVDFIGMARAARNMIWSQRREGASTITMQLARNFYLKRDRTILRKVVEVMLALKIERRFSKEKILERYMNQIYLGHGSYGFTAAAREYYDKTLDELTVAEVAVLAGIPKSPSRLNPRSNPSLTKDRQKHVLRRMRDVGIIDDAVYVELANADLPPLARTARRLAGSADYVAEEVRKRVFDHFGDDAYQRGLQIYTTIQSDLQAAAEAALRAGLLAHEERRGYPGAEKHLDIRGFDESDLLDALKSTPVFGGLQPAIVTRATADELRLISKDGARHTLSGDSLGRAARHLPGGKKPIITAGAVVRLLAGADGDARITSAPGAEGGLVALSSDDGAVLALVGGFDFSLNQFNNVTQARRQPGSAIKPFVYSAALEKGVMPATPLTDTPIFLSREETGSNESWQPKNYDGKSSGKIPMREALAKSKNLATVHLLKFITPEYARDFLLRFGFRPQDHQPYLTLGLGAGVATPMEMARGYAVFANGGYLTRPYLIVRIEDYDGNEVVNEFDYAQRQVVIDARNAYITRNMLQSVISDGTGRSAQSLERGDIGGKTGTTNDTKDAWFAGFGGDITAVSWVGYSQFRTLGTNETGGRAALPIWRDFMGAALAGKPQLDYIVPAGIVTADVGVASGELLAHGASEESRPEFFYDEYLPIARGDGVITAGEAGGLF